MASNFHKHELIWSWKVLPSDQGISPEPVQSLPSVCPWKSTCLNFVCVSSTCVASSAGLQYLDEGVEWRNWKYLLAQWVLPCNSHMNRDNHTHPVEQDIQTRLKATRHRCWFILPVPIPFSRSPLGSWANQGPSHSHLNSTSEPRCREIRKNKRNENTTQHFQWYWKYPLLGQSQSFFLTQTERLKTICCWELSLVF